MQEIKNLEEVIFARRKAKSEKNNKQGTLFIREMRVAAQIREQMSCPEIS